MLVWVDVLRLLFLPWWLRSHYVLGNLRDDRGGLQRWDRKVTHQLINKLLWFCVNGTSIVNPPHSPTFLNALCIHPILPCPVGFIRVLLDIDGAQTKTTESRWQGSSRVWLWTSATLTSLLHETDARCHWVSFIPLCGLGRVPSIKINNNTNTNNKKRHFQFSWDLFDLVRLSSI